MLGHSDGHVIMTHGQDANAVLAAITGRRSIRGYRDEAVPRDMVEQILRAAARAPSGSNIQPWRVQVLTGAAKARLTAAIMAARADGSPEPPREYAYYPDEWFEPFVGRRRALGWRLYELLGIEKGDRDAARAWHDRNFSFFGAPVGMIFSLDRRLNTGSYMDTGMFIQTVMIAARGLGLDTCPQAAFAGYHDIIRRELGLPAEQLVLCGLALGWADPDAVANRLQADREELGAFATFVD